ncbi:phosphatidate cytidylyltransferase [Chryseomicrobium palamuruense]
MKERILTALIALALFIPIVWVGGIVFAVAIYLIATIALYEILRMKQIRLKSIPGFLALINLYVLLLPTQYEETLIGWTGHDKMTLVYVLVFMLLLYAVLVKNTFTYDDAAFVFFGMMYIGIGFYYLIETRMDGLIYVVFALLIVWTTDSGAYFTGRKIGKKKLWPEISPNKTVEGFYGGVVAALVFAILLNWLFPFADTLLQLVLVTIAASIIGQFGDLAESAIKRHYHVKDSGTLLPGHGGILDRFDSLLFVIPLLHFLHFI